jgi:hypothetical protein
MNCSIRKASENPHIPVEMTFSDGVIFGFGYRKMSFLKQIQKQNKQHIPFAMQIFEILDCSGLCNVNYCL